MRASFLQQWLKTPAMVGAIAPSSRYLAKVMARRAAGAGALVELGAGTGTITAELVRQHPSAPLILFEQNAVLASRLHKRFPQATIIADCFHARTDVLAELPEDAVFVSSLPFRSLPAQVAVPTIASLHELLRNAPLRRLIQYTYQPRAPFAPPAGFAWRRCVTVWRNAPPAGVWELGTQPGELETAILPPPRITTPRRRASALPLADRVRALLRAAP